MCSFTIFINKKFLFIYPLPSLLTLPSLIAFTTEEITGCTNEAAKGANKAPRKSLSCFFLFHALLFL